jgi:diamine N-acetyltransferase
MRLNVADQQKTHVAPNAKSLGEAYAYYDTARPFAVYHEDAMIGFVLLRDLPELSCYYISQFMIDQNFQRQGYGRQAMEQLIKMLRSEHTYSKVTLCFVDGAEAAKNLYLGLNFRLTGEVDADEILMALDLDTAD